MSCQGTGARSRRPSSSREGRDAEYDRRELFGSTGKTGQLRGTIWDEPGGGLSWLVSQDYLLSDRRRAAGSCLCSVRSCPTIRRRGRTDPDHVPPRNGCGSMKLPRGEDRAVRREQFPPFHSGFPAVIARRNPSLQTAGDERTSCPSGPPEVHSQAVVTRLSGRVVLYCPWSGHVLQLLPGVRRAEPNGGRRIVECRTRRHILGGRIHALAIGWRLSRKAHAINCSTSPSHSTASPWTTSAGSKAMMTHGPSGRWSRKSLTKLDRWWPG